MLPDGIRYFYVRELVHAYPVRQKGSSQMMIDKRLIGTVSESKKYIARNVALQWLALAANIVMLISATGATASVY